MSKRPKVLLCASRSLEELRAAKAHIVFESQCFMGALGGLLEANKQPPDIGMTLAVLRFRQALVDSMVIHARALIHFAYPEAPIFPDDILAQDFIPDWDNKRPAWPVALDSWRRRVGTEVAHLSYKRLPLSETEVSQWPLKEFLDLKVEMLQVFAANLPPELADPPAPAPPASPAVPGALPLIVPRWPPKPES
jgi:hypothetical protein